MPASTALDERTSKRRFLRWSLGVLGLQSLSLYLLSEWLEGFVIEGVWSVVTAAVLFTVAQAATWPFLYWLAARVHPLLFPLFSFSFSGVLIVVLSDVSNDLGANMEVDGVGTGVVIAVGTTTISTLIGALFSLHDNTAYDWFVIRPLHQEFVNTPPSKTPGFLFLEIDGLAEPIFRKALREGSMPTLNGWLESGRHRLMTWEPDLSSQTSSSQAGILLGDNTEIPAFRWYDKSTQRLMVTSHMWVARELEGRLSTGQGLLLGGASRWNVFSGDAQDSLLTFSTFGRAGHRGSRRYLAYFANPYTISRTVALFIGDVLRERWEATRQAFLDLRPRIKRSFTYALVRASATTLMQEMALFMLIADVFRSTPVVYTTFFAYDEVAHHSGIDRPDAIRILERLDRAIAKLERAVEMAPRPYHLVILSDHGQSMGPTFRQQYGQTLGQLVKTLVQPDARITEDRRITEDWDYLNLVISEAIKGHLDQRTARLIRRGLHRWEAGDTGVTSTGRTPPDLAVAEAAEQSDVVVLASGNLGLVSFPKWEGRLTYEQIVDRVPRLIPGLIAHDGIGFIMVRSEREGGLVLGARGIYYLDHGYAVGENPLASYGPNAADHLRRTDSFVSAPDILVMSRYDPETGEVYAFEELVGSHGGLGGPQTEPFVLFPASLDPGNEPIIGARAVHQVLQRWVKSASTSSFPANEPSRQ